MNIRWSSGYTILEVMIFIAVTGALFLTAILAMGGQTPKVQFNQSMRDIESTVRGLVNDATTGLFNNADKVSCSVDASGVVSLAPSATDQTGKNSSCIFVGKAVQFGESGNEGDQNINIYTLIGRRTKLGVDVQNLIDAKPQIDNSSSYQAIDTVKMSFGTHLKNCATVNSPIIIFTPSLAIAGLAVNKSTSQNVVTYAGPVTACSSATTSSVEPLLEFVGLGSPYSTPLAGTWTACFESADKNQTAKLSVGMNGRPTEVLLEFVSC